MTQVIHRILLVSLTVLALVGAAGAAPLSYELVPEETSVGFSFDVSGVTQSGTMPIKSADIQIDLNDLLNSRVDVVLNVAKARTKIPFARKPMLSESVLNAEGFPTIQFVSTGVQLGESGRISSGAKISGDLTLRGVTRPVVLKADLFRPPGSAADNLNELSIRLTGVVNRHDFGASGFADLVQDNVELDIRAGIKKAE